MDWFAKLPGHRRTPPGFEWTLWKRLPAAFGWATALPVAAGLAFWLSQPAGAVGADDGHAMMVIYQLIGLMTFCWSALITLGFGCVIVMVMKGPGYVADAYHHPERDPSRIVDRR